MKYYYQKLNKVIIFPKCLQYLLYFYASFFRFLKPDESIIAESF